MHIVSKNPFVKQILHGFSTVTGTEWTVIEMKLYQTKAFYYETDWP